MINNLTGLGHKLTFRIKRVVSFLIFFRRGTINSVFGSYISPSETKIATDLALHKVLRPLMDSLTIEDSGEKLVRIGSQNDGGYVLVEKDYSGLFLLSGGISNDNNFEIEFAELGGFGHQVDYSIEEPPRKHKNLTFSPRRIVGEKNLDFDVTLDDLCQEFISEEVLQKKTTILKLDIEGSEWEILNSAKNLGSFDQVLLELHYLNKLADPKVHLKSIEGLSRLLDLYFPIFISGNNCCGVVTIGGFTIPRVMELSLLNRSNYQILGERNPGPNQLFQSQNYMNKAPIVLKTW